MRSSAAILLAIPAPISRELPPERRWFGGPATIMRHIYTRGRCRFTALTTRLTVYRRSTTRMPAPMLWVVTRMAHTVLRGGRPGTTPPPALTARPLHKNIPTAERPADWGSILPPAPHRPLSKGTANRPNWEHL